MNLDDGLVTGAVREAAVMELLLSGAEECDADGSAAVSIIIIIIDPLTERVIRAPQMIS